MIAEEAARAAGVGLVVVRDGAVAWFNESARELVVPAGGAWSGPGSPLEVLAGVRSGARRIPVRWPSPSGAVRWWRVDARRSTTTRMLYEITDETDRYDADGHDTGPTAAQWRLNRMEWISRQGSWIWNLDDGSVEFSEALVAAVEWLPDVPHDRHGLVAGLHADDRERLVAALDRAIEQRERFTVVARGYLDRARIVERVFEWRGEVLCDADGPSHPGAWARPQRHRALPRPGRADLPRRARPADRRGEPAADRVPHRRLRGRPARRRAVDDRHRQLQGHQRPARPRRRRSDHPQGGRRRRRRRSGRMRCSAGSAGTSSR